MTPSETGRSNVEQVTGAQPSTEAHELFLSRVEEARVMEVGNALVF